MELNLECRNEIYLDEKNVLIGLFIIFTPRVMVIEMSKMAHFLVYSVDERESATVWAKYLSLSERSYLALSEKAIDYWVLSYRYQDVNPRK